MIDEHEKIELTARIVAEARSWKGTPFHAHAAVKGAGVDCLQLVRAIYVAAGIVGRIVLPRYRVGEGTKLESRALEWLQAAPEFTPVAKESPHPGDLAVFKFEGIEDHFGVFTTQTFFIHAIRRHGVVELSIEDSTWREALQAIFRPIQLQ